MQMDRTPVEIDRSDRLRVGGDEVSFRVTTAQSGGALVAAEVRMPAGGGPPGLHRHPSAEVYRVEAGELCLYVEDAGGTVERIVAGPGEVVHIAAAAPTRSATRRPRRHGRTSSSSPAPRWRASPARPRRSPRPGRRARGTSSPSRASTASR